MLTRQHVSGSECVKNKHITSLLLMWSCLMVADFKLDLSSCLLHPTTYRGPLEALTITNDKHKFQLQTKIEIEHFFLQRKQHKVSDLRFLAVKHAVLSYVLLNHWLSATEFHSWFLIEIFYTFSFIENGMIY